MNEDTKETMIFWITMGIAAIGIIGIIILNNKQEIEKHQKEQQKEQQKIQECYNKTNDLEWCLNNFNN